MTVHDTVYPRYIHSPAPRCGTIVSVENEKLRNDLKEKLQIQTCKLSKLVQEIMGETE
jgi:hypothetical protein